MSVVRLEPATATSIGSLPHDDPAEAAELVLRCHPALPAVPQLPGSGDGALDAFLEAAAGRAGAVKIQMEGPYTRAVRQGRDGAGARLAGEATVAAGEGAALVAEVRERLPGAQIVAFLDEPALVDLASADPVADPDAVVDALSAALAGLVAADPSIVTGVHCCGPTDWHLVAAAGPDVLSLPVQHAVAQASAISAHLERDGWVAWGAVPTGQPLGTNPDPHWRHLAETWCELTRAGADPVRLRRQALVTPACGLADHGRSQSERILQLTQRIAERVHDQAVAARLSVGA